MRLLIGSLAVLGSLAFGTSSAAAPAPAAPAASGHGMVLVGTTMHSCGWKD